MNLSGSQELGMLVLGVVAFIASYLITKWVIRYREIQRHIRVREQMEREVQLIRLVRPTDPRRI